MDLKNIWFGIIVFGLVILAVVYFNQNYVTPAATTSTKTLPKEVSKIEKGQMVFAKKVGDSTEILAIGNDSKTKVLFSDKTEIDKINFIGSLKQDSQLVVKMGQKLALINLKNGQKKILATNFTHKEFDISPDGKQLAYVNFSNAERDFGYTINLSDFNKNMSEVYRGPNEISAINWAADGLYFVESSDQDRLKVIDLKTKEATVLYESENSIINYNPSGGWLVEGDTGKPNSAIGRIAGKKFQKIITNKDSLMIDVVENTGQDRLAYLVFKNQEENGIIYTANKKGEDIKKIEQGIKIISWFNEEVK